jgi:hypothetical protein
VINIEEFLFLKNKTNQNINCQQTKVLQTGYMTAGRNFHLHHTISRNLRKTVCDV